ncbi:transcriptional regulator [Desulfurococcaceae archaeon MEX13E-LK6-19]|nr:transcriptional regulator [Desulfurococcaceae archaeon MEX13E-LK6-19]
MSEEKREVEELYIDLSNVPLTPTSKKDIQKLETALIIATLYSPEVIELIRDPVERATWVDSLAVAAAALARQKAGYPISQIAEEVGRSETMIRAHLSGKTKAGKLVLQTYEKMLRGELRIKLPFKEIGVPITAKPEVEEKIKELEEAKKKLESEKKELESKIKELEEKISSLEQELAKTREELEKKTKIIEEIKRIISEA